MLQAALSRHGIKASALARAIGVGKPTVSKWCRNGVPAERVAAIEAATGIPRHQLRPDLWPASLINTGYPVSHGDGGHAMPNGGTP